MKRTHSMIAVIGVILLIAVVITTPIIASAASPSKEVTIHGSGKIGLTDDGGQTKPSITNPPPAGSKPKTGDWLNNFIYIIVLLSSLITLLFLLLIKWHKEDIRKPQLQKF